jgi:hypothetical protein
MQSPRFIVNAGIGRDRQVGAATVSSDLSVLRAGRRTSVVQLYKRKRGSVSRRSVKHRFISTAYDDVAKVVGLMPGGGVFAATLLATCLITKSILNKPNHSFHGSAGPSQNEIESAVKGP